MSHKELVKAQQRAIIWMQDFKNSFVAANKYSEIIQQKIKGVSVESMPMISNEESMANTFTKSTKQRRNQDKSFLCVIKARQVSNINPKIGDPNQSESDI